MNLRRIECFLAIVDAGTVTAAAAALHVAQPALSRQVQTLESELGLQLFTHQRNRLQLTPAGHELVGLARHLLDTARSVKSAAHSWSAGCVRKLKLAATPATIAGLIAPFITTLDADDPLILTQEARPVQLHEMLHSGTDMVISPTHMSEDFAHMRLGAVPLRAYVSHDHPWALARKTVVTLDELVRQPLLLHSNQSIARQELDMAMSHAGLAYGRIEECDQAMTIQALAANGRGVGVVTDPPGYPGWHAKVRVDANASEFLGITLHAAWNHQHYSTQTLGSLAARLRDFMLASHALLEQRLMEADTR
ncbi:LysR family transcriptional regulator [Pseudomonas nabeulensis]|uniref:LysR family transcriptional regulator n=1 Tax=Pseudomonas nabeulensis TaxID=2293833 RepID=A0A4Z0B3S6_9PSED|nr:LysR family transcriptional regulator [Pseudomonas nabeulensis]TFY93645.1 LysR family transcriptional regulator [Pseudomonas nabeulensis]